MFSKKATENFVLTFKMYIGRFFQIIWPSHNIWTWGKVIGKINKKSLAKATQFQDQPSDQYQP